jgi:hypothetical protein
MFWDFPDAQKICGSISPDAAFALLADVLITAPESERTGFVWHILRCTGASFCSQCWHDLCMMC